MFVITAMGTQLEEGAVAFVRLRHDHLPIPSRALLPMFASLPPITMVGSRPPWARIVAAIEVVEVFPWLPETAMENFIFNSSASISARGMTGMFRPWAAITSGLSRSDGRRGDDYIRVSDVGGRVASVDRGAQIIQALGDVGGGEVRTADLISQVEENFGDPAHADAADADEMDAPDLPVHAAGFQYLFHDALRKGTDLKSVPGNCGKGG